MKKKIMSLILCVTLVFGLAACGSASDGEQSSGDAGKEKSSSAESGSNKNLQTDVTTTNLVLDRSEEPIASYEPKKDSYYIYCTYKLVHAWYDTIKIGVDKAVEEYAKQGIEIKLDWNAPTEPSGEDQVNRIEAGIAKNPDVIAVDLSDPELAVSAINESEDAGIPVLLYASADEAPDAGCKRTAFIGTNDNVGDAEALTAEICKAIGDEGQIAILSGTIGAANHELRLDGFDSELEKHPNIEVVDSQRDEDFVEKATQITETFIQKYPELKAILCNNMSNPVGAAVAVKDAGKTGEILIGAYDHDRRTLEALKAGFIYCSVIQNCIDMGYWMVKTAVMMADGLEPGADTYPEVYDTGSTIIFQDDADEWIQKLYGES